MTRRYSHLAPSHQQRAVDRLVPVRDLAKRRVRCATKTATEPGVVGTTVTVIACKLFIIKRNAKVAELADAQDLGSKGNNCAELYAFVCDCNFNHFLLLVTREYKRK